MANQFDLQEHMSLIDRETEKVSMCVSVSVSVCQTNDEKKERERKNESGTVMDKANLAVQPIKEKETERENNNF